MCHAFRVLLLAVAAFVGAAVAQAQTVGMYGEYHESDGILIHIPQNPPIVPCVPPPLTAMQLPGPHPTVQGLMSLQHLDARATGVQDARCAARGQHFNFDAAPPEVFKQPLVGNRAARIIGNPAGGLAVGDPFTIPPFAFRQQLGPQVGIILQYIARQLDTTFIAAMPGIDRIGPNPGPFPAGGSYTVKTSMQRIPAPALTRMFSQMNWNNPGNGQNNGRPAPDFAARLAADTSHMNSAADGNEEIRVRYAAGPRQFGGTMALLLDGRGRGQSVPVFSVMIPASFRPLAATFPIGAGDEAPGFRVRAGAGWDLTVPGVQRAGRIKAFFAGFNPANAFTPMGAPRVAPACTQTPLPLPAGCNEINGFDTFMVGAFTQALGVPAGGTLIASPRAATSVRHQFALTTGTVSIVRVALRSGVHFSDTLTGMGYDTLGLSSMGGPRRAVGLVAGSYTIRRDTSGVERIDAQILGLNLEFIPEPGAAIALVGGLGLLGFLANRRR